MPVTGAGTSKMTLDIARPVVPTLMPVDELGVDGAVLFADIMLPLEGMGVSLEIQPDLGPVIHQPIRDQSAVERLRPLDVPGRQRRQQPAAALQPGQDHLRGRHDAGRGAGGEFESAWQANESG